MTTTFEVFADRRAGNYSTMPRLDVEVLPDVHLCRGCGQEIAPVRVPVDNGQGYTWTEQAWVHAGDPQGFDVLPIGSFPRVRGTSDHYVSPATRCRYCHTTDPAEVTFVHAAYSDETRCSRCGGVDGCGIGD